jgi:hypothetical protein
MRSEPLGRAADATVDTDGIAIDLRPVTYGGVTPRQIEITADVLCFIGNGASATPPAPTTTNTAYHEAGTTMLYTLDGKRARKNYWYVHAVTGTADVRASLFG